MSFGLDNPRRRGDDIQVRTAFDLHIIKPVSTKGREWFRKYIGSTEKQFLTGDVIVALMNGFKQLGFQVVMNPPSDTREMRRIVSERLAVWRKKQIVM
jgi:hypothetical protein